MDAYSSQQWTLQGSEATTGRGRPPSALTLIALDDTLIQQTWARPMYGEITLVNIRLRPVGSAPILRECTLQADAKLKFDFIAQHVKRELELSEQSSLVRQSNLFLYVNSSFAPTPDA